MLPISTLRTHNSHPQPYVLVCSLPEYVARHRGGTANVCTLPWKHIVIFFKHSIHAALIEVCYFIHSINKHALSTQSQAGDHGSCKNPYDFVFPLKLLTIRQREQQTYCQRETNTHGSWGLFPSLFHSLSRKPAQLNGKWAETNCWASEAFSC